MTINTPRREASGGTNHLRMSSLRAVRNRCLLYVWWQCEQAKTPRKHGSLREAQGELGAGMEDEDQVGLG